jgi:hypothetical protein
MPRGKRPTQEDLPGIEKKIPELHQKALAYKAIRDDRQQLTAQEVKLKAELLDIMKKHKLTVYECEGVKAELIIEKERVKVTVHGTEEEEDAA